MSRLFFLLLPLVYVPLALLPRGEPPARPTSGALRAGFTELEFAQALELKRR